MSKAGKSKSKVYAKSWSRAGGICTLAMGSNPAPLDTRKHNLLGDPPPGRSALDQKRRRS
jgi:hypothetical protein